MSVLIAIWLFISSTAGLDVFHSSSKNGPWIEVSDSTSIPFRSSQWVKVKVKPQSQGDFALQGGNWYMQNIEFYDEEFNYIKTGNTLKIHSTVNQSQEYYLYYPFIDQKSAVGIETRIIPWESYLGEIRSKDISQVTFSGVLGFIMFVSLIFAIVSRDRVYLHYALYIFSILYFFAYQYGLLSAVFPFVDKIPPALVWISSASLSITYLFFTQSFLDLKERDILLLNILRFGRYFILFVVVIESVTYFNNYDIQHNVFYKGFVILIQVCLMVVVLYRVYKLKGVISRIFLLGASVLMLTTIIGQTVSTIQLVADTNNIIQGGLLLDVFIFSIGISIRVSMIYKDREKAQNELIDQLKLNEKLQAEYAFELEEKVSLRTAELNEKNRTNEMLLKEVHHRVKNNLQMISSLLNMQNRRINEPGSKDLLMVTKTRVRSIGLIHEHLYKHDDISRISLKGYVGDLVDMLIKTFYSSDRILISKNIGDYKANIDLAVSLGLILTELVTNCLKYAYKEEPHPKLDILIEKTDEKYHVVVKDNGPGLLMGTKQDGFGWSIIKSTLNSVDGQYSICNEGGLRVELEMTENPYH